MVHYLLFLIPLLFVLFCIGIFVFNSYMYKYILSFIITLVIVCISGYLAFMALLGSVIVIDIPISHYIFGDNIRFVIDKLSAWFILVIDITCVTGIWYGGYYMSMYKKQLSNISLHFISYILLLISMIYVVISQHMLVFMIFWEIMAITSFLLVIFVNDKEDVIRSGINYLIQMHIGAAFLVLAFIWSYILSSDFSFDSLSRSFVLVSDMFGGWGSLILFILFFVGFAIKAGFIPLHTWLPYAHPSAPSHISGVMSGVMIKTGIYGIMRVLTYIPEKYTFAIGIFLLIISVVTALYGVIFAIVQHDYKRLLAYHSIENIGIIGIGLGIGTIGVSYHNSMLILLGIGGALLHTLNHSLFKSLLFYTVGSVYTQYHIRLIDRLGAIILKMPFTAFAFLFSALAICGLPPFNGFISEFLIYSGLFNTFFISTNITNIFIFFFSILGLAFVGGLAMLCFTKIFGVMFLGVQRDVSIDTTHVKDVNILIKVLYIFIILIMLSIGIFPQFYLKFVFSIIANMYDIDIYTLNPFIDNHFVVLSNISLSAGIFLLLVLFVYLLKYLLQKGKKISIVPTWGCGFLGYYPKIQYTASSFTKPFVSISQGIFDIKKPDIYGCVLDVFPKKCDTKYETHYYDKIDTQIVIPFISVLKKMFLKIAVFQNGKIQTYILYAVVFILLMLSLIIIIW